MNAIHAVLIKIVNLFLLASANDVLFELLAGKNVVRAQPAGNFRRNRQSPIANQKFLVTFFALSSGLFDDMMTANVVPVATNNGPQLAGGTLAPLLFNLMRQEKK